MTARPELPLALLARLVDEDHGPPSLDELAALDGRSKFHLQRTFRESVGETPQQFSRRVRLQRAATELLATDRSVLDIALDAGFDSHEGFTRAFRSAFGSSPRLFRREAAGVSEAHRFVARSAAPCVGLYRRSKTSTSQPRDTMSYEIERKDFGEIPFLYQRRRVVQTELGEAMGEMFPTAFQYAMQRGLEFAGPPTARYLDMSPGGMTLEAGMPLTEAVEPESDDLICDVLVGGSAAVTVHKGPYDTLNEAHAAMEKWFSDQNLEPGGPPVEMYVTDPGDVPDPAEWLTEIRWPIG
ncbi:MAG: helix-turn-helix domain-containing protein [Acidobacteriota bacterium]